jgi:FlaG/FlaF family flagellin (archaellin)
MKNKRTKKAVSEIVGTALLLGISIALFSIVQVIALNLPHNTNPPSVRLVGNIEGETIYIEHHGGESLPLDTEIIFRVNETVYSRTVGDTGLLIQRGDPDLFWDINEKIEFNPDGFGNLRDTQVMITVVDVESSTVIMQSTIQE